MASACITSCASRIEPVEGLADQHLDHVLGFRMELSQFDEQSWQTSCCGPSAECRRSPPAPADTRASLSVPRPSGASGCVQAEGAVRVHRLEHLLGIRRCQPFVELEGPLQRWLGAQQRLGGDARREEELDAVRRRLQRRAQRLIQLRFLDRLGLRIDHVLEVVQQDDGAAAGKRQQRLHLRRGVLPCGRGTTGRAASPSPPAAACRDRRTGSGS